MKILIRSGSCLASGLDDLHAGAAIIEVNDRPAAPSGAQGSIYAATRMDGRWVADLLVKIFHEPPPPTLKDIVTVLGESVATSRLQDVRALRALPLFVFDGTMNGQVVHGYLMRRVSGRRFNQILDTRFNAYINLPLRTRLEICRQFAEGMHALYSLTLVHADINGENLMVDGQAGTLAIIDADGGAVAKNGRAPVVIGKWEPGWLAPEVVSQLAANVRAQRIEIDLKADLWSTACGVHYLLFGFSPFFFLAEQRDAADYLGRYQWPQIKRVVGIRTRNFHAVDYFERTYAQVPELHRLFRCSFQEGYLQSERRATGYQWVQAIGEALAPLKAASGHASTPRVTPPASVSPAASAQAGTATPAGLAEPPIDSRAAVVATPAPEAPPAPTGEVVSSSPAGGAAEPPAAGASAAKPSEPRLRLIVAEDRWLQRLSRAPREAGGAKVAATIVAIALLAAVPSTVIAIPADSMGNARMLLAVAGAIGVTAALVFVLAFLVSNSDSWRQMAGKTCLGLAASVLVFWTADVGGYLAPLVAALLAPPPAGVLARTWPTLLVAGAGAGGFWVFRHRFMKSRQGTLAEAGLVAAAGAALTLVSLILVPAFIVAGIGASVIADLLVGLLMAGLVSLAVVLLR